MSEPETVEVFQEARPRHAPVEYIGRVRDGGSGYRSLRVEPEVQIEVPCTLVARPANEPHSYWRTGTVKVDADGRYDLSHIVAICAGDYVYRIGKPTTPSLEERVAELERRVYRDLIVADDAEKSGRPDIAEKLRANVDWWRDPEIDWTGIER